MVRFVGCVCVETTVMSVRSAWYATSSRLTKSPILSPRRDTRSTLIMRLALLLLVSQLIVAAAFRPPTAIARPLVQLRADRPVVLSAVVEPPEDESPEARRERLEKLGREEAARLAELDSAADDGGLSAAFQARLDAEGGANAFKIKSSANAAKEEAANAARVVKNKGDDLLDAASGLTSGINENQKRVLLIIFGLFAFQIVIGFIGSAFSGGGGGGGGGYMV